ncbi:hypothetical protein [Fulvitalea axinellae]
MAYECLFEVVVAHDYYSESGMEAIFEFSPTTKCAELLKGNQLIIKRVTNGVKVLALADRKENNSFCVDERSRFRSNLDFKVKVIDPYFEAYTKLPCQLNSICVDFDGGEMRVENVKRALKSVAVHIGSGVAVDNLSCYDSLGQELGGYVFKKRGDDIFLDLSKEAEGGYFIRQDDSPIMSLFVAESLEASSFYCSVNVGDCFDDAWCFSKSTLKVGFEAKSGYWKYMIPKAGLNTWNTILIEDKDKEGPVSFDQSGEAEDFIEMISDRELKLSKVCERVFQLKGTTIQSATPKILVRHLPVPKKNHIQKRDERGRTVSEIYVIL